MSSLPSDNAPGPQIGQSEAFSATPQHSAGPTEAEPQFHPGPEFEIQPLPDRPARVDSRTPFQWTDLIYLFLFYFVAGGVLTLIVAAGAFVFFGISPSELKSSTAAWASVMIITQALLSAATLAFLYAVVRGRSGAPFWQTMGWRGFRNMATSTSTVLRYVFG